MVLRLRTPLTGARTRLSTSRWQLWSEKARLTLDAMEGNSEKSKISYFHHWFNGEGIGHIESWKNNKILISQSEYDRLEEHQKEGKYSSDKKESYFTLFESLLAPQVKSITGCRTTTLCQARFYDIWRISFPYCEDSKKMPVPQP